MSFAHAVSPRADDRFRLAMDAAGVAMAIIDLDGAWQEVNPALARMLGHDCAALLAQPLTQCVHPEDRQQVLAQIAELVAGRRPLIDAPWRLLHGSGAAVRAQANVAVMRGESGEPLALVAQLREIGASGAADDALGADDARHAAALEAVNRQLRMFADTVSHDLRAPLRSIESFAGLLAQRASDVLDATSNDYLARVRGAAARMSSLLVAISELSAATRTPLKPTMVDLSLLAEWVVAELQEAEPGRATDIHVQDGLTAYGDEHQLKLLLGHVLGNAWKFSRDCDQVRIQVSGHHDAVGTLHLHVVDAGCGFDQSYAHKLFEPFQRLHGLDQGGGHGLGLAIAQAIAQRHHGRLSAHAPEEGGSCFELELPAAPKPQMGST